MGKTKTPVSLAEQVKRIKYRFDYTINETPKYKSLIDDDSKLDQLPQEVYSTQDGMPVPNTGSEAYIEEDAVGNGLPDSEEGRDPLEPSNADAPNEVPNDAPIDGPVDGPVDGPAEEPVAEVPVEEPVAEVPVEEPVAEPSQEVDVIQNEIIQHNIQAMTDLANKLESLDSYVKNIESNMDILNSKVVEVEEPTTGEKFAQKKDVSFPYYFGLDDVWGSGGKPQGQQNPDGSVNTSEKGIRELPDGTFVADFDELGSMNSMDLDNSF